MTSSLRMSIAVFALAAVLIAPRPATAQPAAAQISTAADYFAQCKAMHNAKDHNQAVVLFQMAANLDPNLAEAHFELSMAYFDLGNYDLVRSSAKKYESLKPGDPNGFMMEGFADRKLNRNAEAITAMQTAIQLKPEPVTNLPSCYYELGMNYYRLGKMQEANQAYQTLKTVSPKWAQDLYDAIHDSDPPAPAPAASKPTQDPSKQSALNDRDAHIAEEVAAIMPFEKLTYSDKIFVLQYRDFSPENKKAADEIWAKIRAQEKDGQVLLQIPKAQVISSTKTTIDVALMSDNQQTKTADTHVTLSNPMITPPSRGSSITIYGVIASYSAKPFLFAVERAQLTQPATKPAAPATAAPISTKPAAPAATLPDLPDLPDARTAIQAANMIGADDLTLTDVIFILQYRDASVSNQNAAKKVWSEVLAKETGGRAMQISNALVISSTKTTVDVALSDDCKHSKTADTHLVLAKPLAAPARAGLVTNISGEITSYKTNPIMLKIERGQLLPANDAASTTRSPAASTHTPQPKPASAPTETKSALIPPGNWISYRSEGGNFAALFPFEPKDTPNPTEDNQVSRTIQATTNEGISYMVVFAQMTVEQAVDETTYKTYRDAVLKGLSTCDVAVESAASPAVRSFVGHAYRLNCVFNNVKMTMVGNLYWGRHYGYAVLAMFAATVSDPPTARKFVDSFSLVDTSK
jgi:tetratricopeptide (TPR) repeat protein